MGSTRKFSAKPFLATDPVYATVTLKCGCETSEPPGISSPRKRWWCCGAWQGVTATGKQPALEAKINGRAGRVRIL